MGVASPKNEEIEGSKVSDIYHTGDSDGLKKISEYCSRDVEATCSVFCKFIGEEQMPMEISKNKDEPKSQTVLQKLYSYNDLNDEIKTEIKDLVDKGKKLTVKQKGQLFTIIRAVYLRCDFVNKDQDFKNTIAEKETEINDFIATLK